MLERPARSGRVGKKGEPVAISFTVGGTKGTFDEPFAAEVAAVLDHAYGAERDWEGVPPQRFGDPGVEGWPDLQARAEAELGPEGVPHLLSVPSAGQGVYLPALVEAAALPLTDGESLHCASLPVLRDELALLADRWSLAIEDEGLQALLGEGAGSTLEVRAYAYLSLAANEAVRRDCPLWVVG